MPSLNAEQLIDVNLLPFAFRPAVATSSGCVSMPLSASMGLANAAADPNYNVGMR